MKWNNTFNKNLVWHKWFAWYPVKIGNENVWLETIERKGVYNNWKKWIFEYRLNEDDKGTGKDSSGTTQGADCT